MLFATRSSITETGSSQMNATKPRHSELCRHEAKMSSTGRDCTQQVRESTAPERKDETRLKCLEDRNDHAELERLVGSQALQFEDHGRRPDDETSRKNSKLFAKIARLAS